MTINFTAKEEFFSFHDPMQNGKLIDRKTEIRMDPLTGETSRIIFDPGAPFTPTDYSELAKETAGSKCPFCPENVQSFTPKFPDELIEGGRLIKGEAVVFPNLFPYSKHNAVVRMCNQHYVKLDEFSAPMIANSFSAAHDYLNKVITQDTKTAYASMNWNYLPPSGGSILHPHIHVLASELPTNYQLTALASSKQFYEDTDHNYYDALIERELEIDERFIGTMGSIDWVHAFAPKSHTDFIGIANASSLDELNENSWQDLADSITKFFRYFEKIGIASFNLGLFIPVNNNGTERVHVRIVPRLTMGALQTSDMNVFNFLHGEPLCMKVPEQTTKEVAAYFNN
jgi:UDPglucose--hexose-1-phosphate uridylyltransferase